MTNLPAPSGPRKSFRFTPDADGIFHVANSKAVGKLLTQRAQEGARQVRKLGPKKSAFFDYRRSVKALPARKNAEGNQEAAVVVETPGWHLPEFGTSNYPATAPIRKGIPLAGMILDEDDGRGALRRLFTRRKR